MADVPGTDPRVADSDGGTRAWSLPIEAPGGMSAPAPAAQPTARRAWLRHLGVLAFLVLIFVPNAGSFGLWDPWETHYGEVTRNMIESGDWVNPWWGYRQKIGTEPQQGKPFYSKPVFIFWSEAVFIRLIGLTEWAFRLPVALMAIAAAFALYWLGMRLWGAATGIAIAVVVATSPQFTMLGRQAQTDMPFVGLMSIALALLALAVFAPPRNGEPRRLRRVLAGFGLLMALSTLPQYAVIATDLEPKGRPPAGGLVRALWFAWHTGGWHVAVYGVLLVALVAWIAVPLRRDAREGRLDDPAVRDAWVRRALLWSAYVFSAWATLAKGLLGFMLPGAIVFVWMMLTGKWRLLRRLELGRGLLAFVCVGFPWYFAMFAGHGWPYYQRFFIHDHFNRLGAGVHQVDTGTFEHFLKWLGYGMLPWTALAVVALALFARFRLRSLGAEGARKLYFFCWFFVSYSLFTASATKFHHYIFPALPGLAVLVGYSLGRVEDWPAVARRVAAAVAVGLVVAMGLDLLHDPQTLRNLFTYKYDRPWPPHLPVDPSAPVAAGAKVTWADSVFFAHTNGLVRYLLTASWLRYHGVVAALTGLAALGFALLAFEGTVRRWWKAVVGAAAVLLALYALNVYMPMISPHWSQRDLFEAYYADCTPAPVPASIQRAYEPLLTRMGLGAIPRALGARGRRVCREDIVSWLITWRGETFYSYNEIVPITKEATQFEDYLRRFNQARRFYVLVERTRAASFERTLQRYQDKLAKDDEHFAKVARWKVERIYDENHYFVLLRVTPVPK